MATNWQPPFGVPFPPPFPPPAPQQPQQQPLQSDNHGAPSDAFAPPPQQQQQQPWSIPGLNVQAHNQNAQQPTFPAAIPTAWPPTFPTPEQMSQWTQMHIDMQQLPFMMMQNTPPLPGFGFPSNPPSQPPFQSATPTQPFPAPPMNAFPAPPVQTDSAVPSTQTPLVLPNERVTEVMDSDKEDGELSEGGSQSPAANGRLYPQPPRSVPPGTARAVHTPASLQSLRQETYNPDKPGAGQAAQTASQSKSISLVERPASTISQQRGDAKTFIRLLHNNNIGYHALAAEDLDAGFLRDLYRSMNLPSEPEPIPSPPKTNGEVQKSLDSAKSAAGRPGVPAPNASKPVTAVNTSVPPTKSVPSPNPVNRAEYLKRLQAAKKGNQSGGAKVTPPQKTPPPASTASKAAPVPQVTDTTRPTQQLTEAEKKAKTTEAIRRRIELLKNKNNPSSPAAVLPSKPPAAVPVAEVSANSPPKPVQASSPAFGAPTPQNMPPSPFGNIPGLFMNPSLVAQSNKLPATPAPSNRKRPFASKMDTPPLKEKGNPVQDTITSPATRATPTQNGLQGLQTKPAIPGFPSRPNSANPSVSGMSTPGPQSPSTAARSQELDNKARKQAALKERLQKKIEEQKRESERRMASVQNSPKPFPQQVSATLKSRSDQEAPRDAKRRRREDVEAEKSAIDTEIAENAAKLAQITKEFEMLTANDAKLRQDKERLQAELQSFGIDTEGMPHAELQARRDEIEREQGAGFETLPMTSSHTGSLPTLELSPTIHEPVLKQSNVNSGGPAQHVPQLPEVSKPAPPRNIPGLNASVPPAFVPSQTPKINGTVVQENIPRNGEQKLVSPQQEHVPMKSSDITSERGPVSQDWNKPMTPVDDEEDFYSPEPATQQPIPTQSEAASTSLAQAESPSEEGEMAMSESEEEDYEPEEALGPQAGTEAAGENAAEQGPTVASSPASSLTSSSASSAMDEDEEPYEPPDVDQPMVDIGVDAEPAKSGLQQGEAEEEEMDMSTSSDDDSDSDTSSESSEEEPHGPTSASSSKNPDSSVTIADDLAPELQPETSALVPVSRGLEGASVTQDEDAESEETNSRSYVPYESPLKFFKSYRYHPNFPQDVSSGYLSMTYSHQIDEEKPLCATESSGAPCNDAACPFQHYRDMQISGETLLVQLGTANPGKTAEERLRWNDGLRSVLKNMRQRNMRDPNGIAIEIANYRRQFLQDDTRVVNL
ncbi:hypothetical protein BU23DRAFT_123632 [Bimuria novae-zelandiae CBS 107.79]|uniref:Zinc-finger domain-containing protein n=1 Tax=Bimuria novae-zelandiae CBS 107.79 TaxID=1447943 RepID=A0A6A5VAM9_9PLEO|nr:hypothetical protein BU23DRAFT_123632 [Bimuria novae-zelandiae CBS 107.79]